MPFMVILQALTVTGAIITASVSVVTALATALITIWYKQREFTLAQSGQQHSQELDNDRLKAEVIRILDARKEYELKRKAFDFERVKKAIELAEKSNAVVYSDKVTALKEYLTFLDKLEANRPPNNWFDEYEDYQRWMAGNTYRHAAETIQFLTGFRTRYAHAYPLITEKLKTIRDSYKDLESDITSALTDLPSENKGAVIVFYAEECILLRNELSDVADELLAGFKEFEQLKQAYINNTGNI